MTLEFYFFFYFNIHVRRYLARFRFAARVYSLRLSYAHRSGRVGSRRDRRRRRRRFGQTHFPPLSIIASSQVYGYAGTCVRAYSRASSPGYSRTVACVSYARLSSRDPSRATQQQPVFPSRNSFPAAQSEGVHKVLTDDLRAWPRCRVRTARGRAGDRIDTKKGVEVMAGTAREQDGAEIENVSVKLMMRRERER